MIERFNERLPGYIGKGYDRESFSHVDDVVSGHVSTLEKSRVGERYLLTGENASFVEVFNLASKVTNTKPPRFHFPLWLLEIYGWISVFVSRLTGKPPFISYPVCLLFLSYISIRFVFSSESRFGLMYYWSPMCVFQGVRCLRHQWAY
jgi:hypothetical protein